MADDAIQKAREVANQARDHNHPDRLKEALERSRRANEIINNAQNRKS